MKKAIGYVRISDIDQSNWSLPGQEKDIRKYCENNSIQLLSVFSDNGQSAKNFDRAEWKELFSFIKKHHREIDQLLVVAYDRFSRNVSDALDMILKLEKHFDIDVVSITQPISLPRQSPYHFLMRTQILMSAELELRVIRDRTKTGMVRAANEGRFCSKAPVGYINQRDSFGKPIIVVDKAKEPYVKELFRLFILGVTPTQILRQLPELTVGKITTIVRMIKNPVYAGLINVPAYYDEPAKVVKGIHQGIVSESDYWKAQTLLNKPQPKYILNEAVPLRGVLRHDCGKMLTAGNSRGKKKHYWYYVCPECGENLSAIRLHDQLSEMVKYFKLGEKEIEYVKYRVEQGIKDRLKSNYQKIEDCKKDLVAVKKKIHSLEEKYIAGDIDREAYKRWKVEFETAKGKLENDIVSLNIPIDKIWARMHDKIGLIEDLPGLFYESKLEHKQEFIRQVFNSNLQYGGDIYRTPYISPLFAPKAAILKEKRLLEVQQPLYNLGFTPVCAPGGT
ncbi:MAG TPA: recombinase family protein [Flavipsychrobacter sp.]|nr:recombinase family protein [Flavipsychrobacter sp.]